VSSQFREVVAIGRALTTDLYEINMAASYLARGMTERAVFSLFVRRLPPGRGFLVSAGLEDCLTYLESFEFEDQELAWLGQAGYPAETVAAFADMRFTGDIHAVPEGRIVLPDEPILEVTAPIAEAQLVETYLLNQITYQVAIATKAVRCRLAAGPIEVVDFSLRRTHGIDAGLAAARLSALAGFTATSNVEAARRYGLKAVGTMAHSYIEAFPSERDAFRAFAIDHPSRVTFLVDTYDTLGGIDHAIAIIEELGLEGPLGIRLDSGDLAELARQARYRLDATGHERVRIFVSGGLDEYALEELRLSGAPVDAAGVGTKMGVSADAPYLDSAYKIVAIGDRPVMKLSRAKATVPGPKQVWRSMPIAEDLLCRRDEDPPPGTEALLVPVMAGGRRVGPPASISESRARLDRDLDALEPAAKLLRNPVAPTVRASEELVALRDEVAARMLSRVQPATSDRPSPTRGRPVRR
jgi:nicotinate phosphoribosyltransferase